VFIHIINKPLIDSNLLYIIEYKNIPKICLRVLKMNRGNKYGTHRVIEPKGTLPQPAFKISNDTTIFDNEILINVDYLNIDSASFTQLEEEAGGDIGKIKSKILEIVQERGKMQNPIISR